MYEIAWQEFDRNDRIVCKRRAFKSERARTAFAAKLEDKPSFYRLLALRNPEPA